MLLIPPPPPPPPPICSKNAHTARQSRLYGSPAATVLPLLATFNDSRKVRKVREDFCIAARPRRAGEFQTSDFNSQKPVAPSSKL